MTAGDRAGSHLTPTLARRLGLDPCAAPEAARAAILRRLRDVDFLPDPVAHDAVKIFGGRPAGGASLLADFKIAEEERLRTEVEAFASGFFDLSPRDRRQRWQVLVDACAGHEGLLDRLRGLAPGLDVSRASIAGASPALTRLTDDLLTLFVLRPGPRAALSRDLAWRFRSDPSLSDSDRVRVRRELEQKHPKVAALSPDHLARLKKPRRPFRAARSCARAASWLHTHVATLPYREIRIFPVRKAKTSSHKGGPRWTIAAMMIFWTLSALSRLFNVAPSPPVTPAPSLQTAARQLQQPPNSLTKPLPWLTPFTRNDIKTLLRSALEKHGKRPDNTALQKIVDALRVDALPRDSSAATGPWTQANHDRCVAVLKGALARAGLGLTETEVDVVARSSFPEASFPDQGGRSSGGLPAPDVSGRQQGAP